MEFINDILNYTFLSNALIACLLSGFVCGVVGTYVVSKRQVFLSGGITHASFGGIGIAYFLGWNPIIGAMIFSVLSAVGIEWISSRGEVREDSAIGIIWSVGMALGVIFIYLTPGYAPNLMSFLFGSIVTVTQRDIIWLGMLAVVVLVVFLLFMRPIIYVAFDREYAKTQGAPVKLISYMMSILVALAIVLSIRTVGIILLISLLTIPAVVANSISKSYKRITIGAALVGMAGNVLGLWLSYTFNVPAGAATVFVLSIVLICVKLLPLLLKDSAIEG